MSLPAPQRTQSDRAYAWGRAFILIIIAAMLLQFARVVQLKIAPDPRLAATVGSPTSSRTELARRGDLLDRRGRVLATSSLGYRLFLDPQEVADIQTIAVDLAQVLRRDPAQIDQKIIPRRHRRYVVIDHLLEDWEVDAIRAAGMPGVGLEPRLVRHYPHDELAAAIVGFVGFEHSGLGGAEYLLDDRLAPEHGRLTFLRDARRRALWIEPEGYEPAQPGRPVQLSIDLVIQDIAQKRLQQAVEEFNAGGGRLVVMDSRTGELLALVDILNPREGWDEYTSDPLRATDPALGRNRCVTDPYEPGSTFKPFIWALATELGVVHPDEVLPTPPPGGATYRTSRGRAIRDAFPHENASWRTVLVRSLNSGMAMIGERLTSQQMRDGVIRFGFGHETRCGLPGESAGIITNMRDWNHYTQTSVPIGQEIAVTPVQMVRAFAVFARDGTLPPVRTTAAASTQTSDVDFDIVHRVLNGKTVTVTREVMLEAADRRVQSSQYRIFGKSGTAQLPRRDGRGYHEDRYVSSYIAAAPYTEPRIVVLCVLDDPDKSIGHYGGRIAAPVVRDVIDQALQYLGVPPDQPGATSEALIVAR